MQTRGIWNSEEDKSSTEKCVFVVVSVHIGREQWTRPPFLYSALSFQVSTWSAFCSSLIACSAANWQFSTFKSNCSHSPAGRWRVPAARWLSANLPDWNDLANLWVSGEKLRAHNQWGLCWLSEGNNTFWLVIVWYSFVVVCSFCRTKTNKYSDIRRMSAARHCRRLNWGWPRDWEKLKSQMHLVESHVLLILDLHHQMPSVTRTTCLVHYTILASPASQFWCYRLWSNGEQLSKSYNEMSVCSSWLITWPTSIFNFQPSQQSWPAEFVWIMLDVITSSEHLTLASEGSGWIAILDWQCETNYCSHSRTNLQQPQLSCGMLCQAMPDYARLCHAMPGYVVLYCCIVEHIYYKDC